MIRYDPTLVDMTKISLFYVQTWKFIYIIIHNGWSLAWIFMKERVKLLLDQILMSKVMNMNVLKIKFYSQW